MLTTNASWELPVCLASVSCQRQFPYGHKLARGGASASSTRRAEIFDNFDVTLDLKMLNLDPFVSIWISPFNEIYISLQDLTPLLESRNDLLHAIEFAPLQLLPQLTDQVRVVGPYSMS